MAASTIRRLMGLLSVTAWGRMEGEMEAVLDKPVRTRWVFHARARRGETILPRGGIVVVVQRSGDGYDTAVSLCSPRDNYCKRVGVRIAATRLKSRQDGKRVHNTVHVVAVSPRAAAHHAMLYVLDQPSAHRAVEEYGFYQDCVVAPFERRITHGSPQS